MGKLNEEQLHNSTNNLSGQLAKHYILHIVKHCAFVKHSRKLLC